MPPQLLKNKKAIPFKKSALTLKRLFSRPDKHPFDEINWVKQGAQIDSSKGKVFEQKDIEFPDFWSANAVNITASKYFRGKLNTPERENSVKQMINRVVKTMREWGEKNDYFDKSNGQIFEDELSHLLVYQKGAFNSPVWFNVGIKEKPQCSACFILSIEDNMPSILEWVKTEGMIFKGGSGAGINLSTLRSKYESLSSGGRASGPVSFMRGADAVAGMIKSGGTTRRAAKMVILNIDHPDIMDFIRCKAEEENKIRALMSAGYDMSDLNNEAWNSIQFQNANNSVRITDDFMRAVESNGNWDTKFVINGQPAQQYKAKELLMEMARAAWESGDPGVQFDTTINTWHTCPNSGRINGSNPCSEFMHIDNSSCNLASINLMKFINEEGRFKTEEFKQAVRIFILAQEIIVSNASYPTEKIEKNSHNLRQLGLGYANLGALLMTKGLSYDSEEGRAWAGAITSLLSGEAYRYSAEIASKIGPFSAFSINREPMLKVINKHRLSSFQIKTELLYDNKLANDCQKVWEDTLKIGEKHGFRNSQVSVLAPTGTISFMMDCDTTGIEPDYSLVKMKQLVGGGWMKIINNSVETGLKKLGYNENDVKAIEAWIAENGNVEGAPNFKEEHLAVFDCAAKPSKGTRFINWQGHVRMVAAVQPFISGAISKTFNMHSETSKEEIAEAFMMAWKMGIKAFAVYRDGSKATQPLQAAHAKPNKGQLTLNVGPSRRRLPATRGSETHKFAIAGHEGYLTYSFYEDGTLAEIFIKMAKQGSTLSGMLDSFGIAISIALQYGVPLKDLAHKFVYVRFEPAGFTDNQNIRIATSIIDYIFRYLALRFLTPAELGEFGMANMLEEKKESVMVAANIEAIPQKASIAAENTAKNLVNGFVTGDTVCRKCGGMMVRTGSCLTCLQCGESSGGCS